MDTCPLLYAILHIRYFEYPIFRFIRIHYFLYALLLPITVHSYIEHAQLKWDIFHFFLNAIRVAVVMVARVST